ncbi:S9 family peptidase [Enterovirga rhinocerotis]|uniref:Dipeptidyl aminopeptidase/acylaminoacyl peptidase n=1 Tax=Enterovirga rhinocerotis TaxID=1339210 RepID=A0A4R7BV72_9HYPH|nr:S9 family peptidase [Enterovirga rhinocerotis]TDR88097.1 dipeptidyl aminopeptidase/acylaminoacyl peptidase [Enterovirga rhinocerotis]
MKDLIPRRHLFGNPVRASYQISPDGSRLAWLAPLDDVLNVWVAPTDDLAAAKPVTQDKGRGIIAYFWTYDGRHLVYVQDREGDENYHVYAVDPDLGESRDLTPIDGVAAHVVGVSRIRRGEILVALNDRDPRFHDLHIVDLATGERRLIQENPGFLGFVTDEDYAVHFAVQPHPDGSSEVLKRDGDAWTSWLVFDAEDTRVSGPDHLDASGRVLFCRDSRGRDTAALTRIDVASGEAAVLAAHDEADVGAVIHDVETFEPLAYAVNHERSRWHALDERIAGDLAFLDGQPIGDWRLAGRTEDDRLWVVAADSDTRPGRTWLYDREARRLTDLGTGRPELDGLPLAPMRALTIRARDGLGLVSYLTRPLGASSPGPLVLLVHGGPWGRDAFGFNVYHQWLADRGYAVLSVNFRASTGFGKSFVNAGDREWGRRMDDDLLDAVDWAIAEGVADPKRIAIMGGSYGGYAVLAAMTRNPDLYACGVDIVGPANLDTLLKTVPPYWESFRAQLVRAIGDPDTEEGMALIRDRSPVHHADRIRAPLLIAQGANDPRVKQAESDQMVEAMTAKGVPVTYLLFPDEGHGFVRPPNRLAFNERTEAFLARHLGGRAEPGRADETVGTTMQIIRDDPPRA